MNILQAARELGVNRLITRFATDRNMLVTDLLGRSQKPKYCRARRDLYIKLRLFGLSYPEIGRCVGRDHSTVFDAVKSQGWADRPRVQKAIRRCTECGAIKGVG